MEITLTPELETLINEELQTGDYFSPSDVLREGLLSLRARRIPKAVRLENLRREVQKGLTRCGREIIKATNRLMK